MSCVYYERVETVRSYTPWCTSGASRRHQLSTTIAAVQALAEALAYLASTTDTAVDHRALMLTLGA